MSTQPTEVLDLGRAAAPHGLGMERLPDRPAPTSASRAARAEALQRNGRRMVVAGAVITIVGVVLYCAVCFAGGVNADMADLLFQHTVPFGLTTLAVQGAGTLVWLVGSFTYLRGAMDAEPPEGAGDA